MGSLREQNLTGDAMNPPDDELSVTLIALRTKYAAVSKRISDLGTEMAGLSADTRRERMPEFDARVMALIKDQDNIELCAKAFLQPSRYPGGNA